MTPKDIQRSPKQTHKIVQNMFFGYPVVVFSRPRTAPRSPQDSRRPKSPQDDPNTHPRDAPPPKKETTTSTSIEPRNLPTRPRNYLTLLRNSPTRRRGDFLSGHVSEKNTITLQRGVQMRRRLPQMSICHPNCISFPLRYLAPHSGVSTF